MKAIVFDNAGTILRRVTALKNMSNNNIIFETNTVSIVDKNDEFLLLVFQTPTKKLIKQNCKIVDYLKTYPNSSEITYSTKKFTKKNIINALENDLTTINDIKESAFALKNRYSIEICSGSAMIVNMKDKKIEYVYTAGGLFFESTRDLFKNLNKKGLSIFIASGDNKQSLYNIASILNVPKNNVYDTCNRICKEHVIQNLQKKI